MKKLGMLLLWMCICVPLVWAQSDADEGEYYLQVVGEHKIVNVFSGPGIGYPILAKVQRYDYIKPCGRYFHWYMICLENGKKGYISRRSVMPVRGVLEGAVALGESPEPRATSQPPAPAAPSVPDVAPVPDAPTEPDLEIVPAEEVVAPVEVEVSEDKISTSDEAELEEAATGVQEVATEVEGDVEQTVTEVEADVVVAGEQVEQEIAGAGEAAVVAVDEQAAPVVEEVSSVEEAVSEAAVEAEAVIEPELACLIHSITK